MSPQLGFRAVIERNMFFSLHNKPLPKPLWELFLLPSCWGRESPSLSSLRNQSKAFWLGVNCRALLSLNLSPLCVTLTEATKLLDERERQVCSSMGWFPGWDYATC